MKTILKILEDAESDDDELNARIWCFKNGKEFVGKSGGTVFNPQPEALFHAESKTMIFSLDNFGPIPEYTTSLDAAMSIGAEELEGWQFGIGHSPPIDCFQCRLTEKMGPDAERIESPWNSRNKNGTPNCQLGLTMNRAICSARLQALEYVRGL